MSFKDLRISHKLIACFSSVLLIVVATTGIMFHTLSQLDNVAEFNSASSEVLDRLDVAATRFFDVAFTSRGAVMIKFDSELKRYDASRKAYAAAMDQVKKSAANYPDMAKVVDAVDTVATRWLREVGDPVFEMMQDGSKVDDAFDLSIAPSAGDIIVKYRDAIADARGKVQAWSNGAQREQDAHMSFLRKLQVAGGLVAMFAAAFAGWLLSRAIGRPLVAMTSTMTCLASGDHSVVVPATGRRDEIGHMADAVQCFKEAALAKLRLEAETAETRRQATVADAARESEKTEAAAKLQYAVDTLAESLKRLSNGDLTCRIETSFVGEADRLRADFNASLDTLEQAMLTVAANVQALRSGSGEITSAADDLSRRTEQQAASLEETAAALDQITATVKKTAAGALHARDAVTNARSDAEASGRIVQRAVDAMSGIETSSRQIGQIIGVIDEIAFQTNLLALNAGVEAARAGDAGRGFAVVASEVRALAQRSAEAAREIKGLISASAVHVGQGVELVGETGRSLARIVTQVAEINGVVADIAASAQEQATALGEVNTAINQMDQVTQQNAAMVEQSTAASHALSHDAAALGALVAKFNTGTALVPQAVAREMRRPALQQVAPPRPAVAAKPSATRPALKHTRASGGSIVRRLNAVAKVDSESWEEF